MGDHRRRVPTRRRVAIASVMALLIAGGSWVGVDALVRSNDEPKPTVEEGSKAPPTSRSATPLPATKSPGVAQRARGARFPGQPRRTTGLTTESGTESGLGNDAGDLAGRAQDLIDESNSPEVTPPEPLSFVVSSFNVLGAAHTSPGGTRSGLAPWQQRMWRQIRLLEDNQVDVVGLQEFEHPQFRGFVERTGGAWGVYPGLSMGRNFVRNSIAWRRDVWELADYDTVSIPYFSGQPIEMPVILLTHKRTGRQAYFFNIHNPTSNPRRGNNERWRDLGKQRELATVRRLKRAAPRVPVVLTGDFNEVNEAYCTLTRGGDMVAANPGGDRPGCALPRFASIDWIFGTSDISFSNYVVQRTGGASDHPMLLATATVP